MEGSVDYDVIQREEAEAQCIFGLSGFFILDKERPNLPGSAVFAESVQLGTRTVTVVRVAYNSSPQTEPCSRSLKLVTTQEIARQFTPSSSAQCKIFHF